MNRDYFRHTNVEGFYYLHDDMRKEAFQWIANIRIHFDTIKQKTLETMYSKLNSKANKLCANSFRIIKSDLYSNKNEKYIEMGIYYLKWEDRDENRELFQARKVYTFGLLGYHRIMEGYKIVVNGEKFLLKELRYKLFESKNGTKIKIKLGKGIKKSQVNFVMKNDTLPRYFKFNHFKGIFKRSLIDEYKWSFGELLVHVMKKERHRLD